MNLGNRNIEQYKANTTKLTFIRMIVSVHATDCIFYLLDVNGNVKKGCFLLLNGTQYASPKNRTQNASLK